MFDSCSFAFIVVLIIIFVIIYLLSQSSNQYPYYMQMMQEQMAPLSVFDHPDGVSYVLQPPRKYMSQDIRGDPLRIPKQEFPWLNSEIPMYDAVPIYYGELLN